MIEIYPPGTKAYILDVEVLIIAVCIRAGENVSYQVTWWDGLVRKEEWVQSCEVYSSSPKFTIGFKS